MRALLLATLAGCGGDAADSAEDDSCVDVPDADWETFGRGFVTENCQACHASAVEGERRYGAPEDVVFDTADDVWARAGRVLARAGAEPPTMPPEGGTEADDRVRLWAWLECGAAGE